MSINGQVTIPRDVRERLGLQAGDKMAWSLPSNGTVVVRQKTRRMVDLVGMLTRPGQPDVTVAEMGLPEWVRPSTPNVLVRVLVQDPTAG